MAKANNFNRDIKGTPLMSAVAAPGGIIRRLSLSSSASETGINSARQNIKGYQ